MHLDHDGVVAGGLRTGHAQFVVERARVIKWFFSAADYGCARARHSAGASELGARVGLKLGPSQRRTARVVEGGREGVTASQSVSGKSSVGNCSCQRGNCCKIEGEVVFL